MTAFNQKRTKCFVSFRAVLLYLLGPVVTLTLIGIQFGRFVRSQVVCYTKTYEGAIQPGALFVHGCFQRLIVSDLMKRSLPKTLEGALRGDDKQLQQDVMLNGCTHPSPHQTKKKGLFRRPSVPANGTCEHVHDS